MAFLKGCMDYLLHLTIVLIIKHLLTFFYIKSSVLQMKYLIWGHYQVVIIPPLFEDPAKCNWLLLISVHSWTPATEFQAFLNDKILFKKSIRIYIHCSEATHLMWLCFATVI